MFHAQSTNTSDVMDCKSHQFQLHDFSASSGAGSAKCDEDSWLPQSGYKSGTLELQMQPAGFGNIFQGMHLSNFLLKDAYP